mgnify:CR=1 FL=1
MLKTMLKTLLLASALTISGVAQAADITLRVAF